MAFKKSNEIAPGRRFNSPRWARTQNAIALDSAVPVRSVAHLIANDPFEPRQRSSFLKPLPPAFRTHSRELNKLRRADVWKEGGNRDEQINHMSKWFPTLKTNTSGRTVAPTFKTELVTQAALEDIFALAPPPLKIYDYMGKPTSNMGVLNILPAELRVKIYKYVVLEEDGNDIMVKTTPCSCSRGRCLHGRAADVLPGILTTCRQIRYEAGSIFFGDNTGFIFDHNVIANCCAPNYLRAMGAGADLVKEFKFELEIPVFNAGTNDFLKYAEYVFTIVPPKGPDGEFTISQSSAFEEELGKICQCTLEGAIMGLNSEKDFKSVGMNLAETLNHEHLREFMFGLRTTKRETLCKYCNCSYFPS